MQKFVNLKIKDFEVTNCWWPYLQTFFINLSLSFTSWGINFALLFLFLLKRHIKLIFSSQYCYLLKSYKQMVSWFLIWSVWAFVEILYFGGRGHKSNTMAKWKTTVAQNVSKNIYDYFFYYNTLVQLIHIFVKCRNVSL